jgi:mannose-6-phosphate isomerase-like protein (cupin superfamily)
MIISATTGLEKLKTVETKFVELFKHGTLSVEIYKPEGNDLQTPHERDEIYVVIEGHGIFFLNDKTFPFQKGDFIFVPAGIEHRFETFSSDFSTWVFFYGPKGGEKEQ